MAIGLTSLQTGTLTIAAADGTSGTISITAVAVLNSVPVFLTSGGDNARIRRHVFRVRLTESNPGVSGYDRITWNRHESGFAADVPIRWYVVEYASAYVQTGTHDCTADPTDITISSVSASAFPMIPFQSSQDASERVNMFLPSFTSATNLRLDFTIAPATTNCHVQWYVVDFGTSDSTIQTGIVSITGTNNSNTATVTAPGGDYVILLFPRVDADTTNNLGRLLGRVSLSGTTLTVNADMFGSGGDRSYTFFIIEFEDGTNAGTASLSFGTSDTTLTSAISAADPADCMPMIGSSWQQNDLNADDAQEDRYFLKQRVYDNAGTPTFEAVRTASTDALVTNVYWVEWGTGGGGPAATILPDMIREGLYAGYAA